MAKRYHGSYEDKDDVRRLERQDSAMAPSGDGAHAGMPTELVMKAYPKEGNFMPENLDDTIKGVDAQKSADNNMRRKLNVPKKV
jgi:hypothetical protein